MGTRRCASESTVCCDAVARKLRRIRESLRRGSRCPTGRLSIVSDLTDLSAGGLRSRRSVGAAIRAKAGRPRGVGANPRHGLASTERHHTSSYWRPPSTTILGSKTSRVFCPKRNCKQKHCSDETGLLRSERISLGRSTIVPSRGALEGWSRTGLLEWPCRQSDFTSRTNPRRASLIAREGGFSG